jgi:hypothetical protein
VSTSRLEELSAAYEQAESEFLDAVRARADRAALAPLARGVATAAGAFNAEAHREYHAGAEDAWLPLDWLTERTEVLAELWRDVAAAYET